MNACFGLDSIGRLIHAQTTHNSRSERAAASRPASGQMEDVGSGGFETKGIGLWIEAFGPERSVAWPAFVAAIEVRGVACWVGTLTGRPAG